MIRAVTFDFWDTLFVDGSDEPARAELGKPTKEEARDDAFIKVLHVEYPEVSREEAIKALRAADAHCRRLWHEVPRTPTVTERLQEAFARLHRPPTVHFDQLVTFFETIELDPPPSLAPGAADCIAALAQDYKLGVVSDTIVTPGRGLRWLLDHVGIAEHFSALVFSDEVGVAKPAAGMFEAASAALEVELSEIVHVGDRVATDVLGPHLVGARSVLFTGVVNRNQTPLHAAAVCEDLADLPAILAGLDA